MAAAAAVTPITKVLVAAATLSLFWTPHSPYEVDMSLKLLPPGAGHWLGTDPYGRDVVSLLLVGARASIVVGVIAVGIGLVIGTAFGLLAAARPFQTEIELRRKDGSTFWAQLIAYVVNPEAPAQGGAA